MFFLKKNNKFLHKRAEFRLILQALNTAKMRQIATTTTTSGTPQFKHPG